MRIVNFGCGAEGSYDHLNVDGSVTVLLARLPIPAWAFGRRAQFIAAIRKNRVKYGTASRLRFPPASLDAFYTSHTLEHLSRHDCEELLQRVHKWLKPNGILRVVLPDLRAMAAAYLKGEVDADRFISNTKLRDLHRRRFAFLDHIEHRWMYDCDSFMALLGRIGYREVQRSEFCSSRSRELAALDISSRKPVSFYVEALK